MSGGVLVAPAAKENGGCADCSAHGLLAYGAGGSVVIVDVRSMQLVTVLPMPSPASRSSSSLPPVAPFVTALQWLPGGVPVSPMDELPAPALLQLAAGDRQGRIAIWDLATTPPSTPVWLGSEVADSSKARLLGVQQVCWVHSSSWLLAAIHGPSLLIVWNPATRSSLWKYDSSALGDTLTCLRRDPFEQHQLCALGIKGLLVSLLVSGTSDTDFHIKIHQLAVAATTSATTTSSSDERDRSSSSASVSSSSSRENNTSVSGSMPLAALRARCMFSSQARGILYVMFSREILVFDLHFGMTLSVSGIPRGCGKLLDLVADVSGEVLLCAHVDGKLSAWRRKEGSQVFAIAHIDSLVPSIGTTVPPPTMLAVSFCPIHFYVPAELRSRENQPAERYHQHNSFTSISDDGRLWYWALRLGFSLEGVKLEDVDGDEQAFQLELAGQLHLLPSSVTTLAVPVPSLLATVSGGGNGAATPVQLVALATQAGSLELVDPTAFAVTSSFSVHGNSAVRGVRWLGNSRLVSFSYTEVKGKGGGFINRLAVTCVRSGQSRFFRVLQKPERAPMRALRTSPSGRYMLILFREAPAEVWAMTKNPQMLRSLALPFTVMEWALPAAPKARESSQASGHRPSLAYRERPTIASTLAAANAPAAANDPDTAQEETGESFAFALVNGSLGVFELRGRRVRDFKPKWPVSSFVSTDVLVTAMAYRMPHVVMGDRLGNLRWWDVATGSSSWFNTHRGGIRRIKFAPVILTDSVRGRVAILFNDNSLAVYDLDTQDPLANSSIQPQLSGVPVVELDWFPVRSTKKDPLLLCIVGADSSFRMLEVQTNLLGSKSTGASWNRQRPMPLHSPALLPCAQALALRMLLQLGVHSSWFSSSLECSGDLRQYLLDTKLPPIGDPVVLEVLLKALESYRRSGRLLDAASIRSYSDISNKGCAARLAFAAAYFGDDAEAAFWLQLPRALMLLSDGSAGPSAFWNEQDDAGTSPVEPTMSNIEPVVETRQATAVTQQPKMPCGSNRPFVGDRVAVCAASQERISWHRTLGGDEAIQKLVHEHVAVGDFEAAVTLLLATPPDNSHFYVDALRAVSLAAAVSPALHELAIKVVAANMVATDDSLAGTHLLCAVGRYQEACSQLQDAGRWEDASTLAASKLKGSEHARVLHRWAGHVLQNEHNLWRAATLYVASGALSEALVALNAHHTDVAAMFLLACHEAKAAAAGLDTPKTDALDLPASLASRMQDVKAVCEFYGQHQRWLAKQCSEMTFY